MDVAVIKRSLEDSGLRCTPQRYAVMAFLMKHNRHPTAAEIFEGVNRLDPRSSRATTYNNLRDLVQAGLVREVISCVNAQSIGQPIIHVNARVFPLLLKIHFAGAVRANAAVDPYVITNLPAISEIALFVESARCEYGSGFRP